MDASEHPPQRALLAEFAGVMFNEELPLGRLATLAFERLNQHVPLQRVVVFARQETSGAWAPWASVGGSPDSRDTDLRDDLQTAVAALPAEVSSGATAGLPREAASPRIAGTVESDYSLAVPLRSPGRVLGVLLLVSTAPSTLSAIEPDVVTVLSGFMAGAILREATWRNRLFAERSTRAIRRLFEEGALAGTVEEAGEVLARVAAEAFETERAGMYVTDAAGRISFAVGVGIAAELSSALSESLIGKVAAESPVWQVLVQDSGPSLVDDAGAAAIRPGGFVQTLAFKSYVAIPLLSTGGPLGMVICGEASRLRTWTLQEQALAKQFALEGALVMDAARLRVAERAHLAEITYQAFHDRLTGLPNRALLLDRAQQALAAAVQSGNGVAMLLIDLNNFKQVNDTLGHHHGDVLLQGVAKCLRAVLREADTVARLGGDEFAILLTGNAGLGQANTVAAKVEKQLSVPIDLDGIPLQIVPSIGIALYPDHGSDASELLQRADIAMYAAKRSGDGPTAYHSSQDRSTLDKLTVFTELRQAIENSELRLHYQPKLDLQTATITGVEALVRWQHPRRGLLGPGEFLPVAESTGLIHPLTDWVLTEAVSQWALWTQTEANLDLAVNVSVRSLLDRAFFDRLTELLVHSGIARHLILEVTETALMLDPVQAARTLADVRKLGVRVSMDDFGAGYSSLTQLRQLPVDELKIDRMLVQDVATSDLDAALMETIIELGHRLDLKVVAEGIEDADTLAAVRALGCDQAQGFFIARPMPPEQIADAIRRFPGTQLSVRPEAALRVVPALPGLTA
ncbi:MAG: hypothetical protein QOJ62_686 [Actinomycetota bacterium]|nr:hypothetical protein [Actinomycetota bacterium]